MFQYKPHDGVIPKESQNTPPTMRTLWLSIYLVIKQISVGVFLCTCIYMQVVANPIYGNSSKRVPMKKLSLFHVSIEAKPLNQIIRNLIYL